MKAKSTIGKIYVSTNAYLGVLKHFVEDSVKAVIYMFSLKKELGIAKVICKPLVLVSKTAQKSCLSKLGEMAHV